MSSETLSNSEQNDNNQAAVETVIAGIFEDLLRVERVTAEDNLLMLGGESLVAAQIISRLRDQYGVEVSLRSVLVGTVTEVAAEIKADLEFKEKS